MTEPRAFSCERHGEYVAAGDRYTAAAPEDCRSCRAEAHALEAAWRAAWATWRRVVAAGIPSRFARATLDSWIASTPAQRVTLGLVRRWCERTAAGQDDGLGLTLSGPPGLGKTHLGVAALWYVLQHSRQSARYSQWTDTLAQLKTSAARRDHAAADVIDELKGADVLVLDEIGVRPGSEYDLGVLFDVVDHRYREQLPTIVCTNATGDQACAMMGERVADRLREVNELVLLTGTSRRTGIAKPATGPLPIERPADAIEVPECYAGRFRLRRIEAAPARTGASPTQRPLASYERAPLPLYVRGQGR